MRKKLNECNKLYRNIRITKDLYNKNYNKLSSLGYVKKL